MCLVRHWRDLDELAVAGVDERMLVKDAVARNQPPTRSGVVVVRETPTIHVVMTLSDLADEVASLVAGVSWICVLATLNVSAQVALPEWVRAQRRLCGPSC